MIEKYITTNGDLSILYIGSLDIYNNIDDRIYLKNTVNRLFKVGEEIFFFFNREESLTDGDELARLREGIFATFENYGQFEYLYYADSSVFDAIARMTYDPDTANFIIDIWKYFYACSFFKPINDLTFDEYQDYLEINGVNDINGLKQLWDKLSEFVCTKNLGGSHLILSYYSDLKLDKLV